MATESMQRLEALLGQTWRITIQDNRIFIGTLVCTDKERNIILTNTEEYRRGVNGHGRFVGMVMIPWRWVTKTEVEWGALMDAQGPGGEEAHYT